MKNDDLKNIFDYIKIPRDKIINFEINQSYDSVPTISIEAAYEPSMLVKDKSYNIKIDGPEIKLTSSVADCINSNTITVSERIDKLEKKMKEWKDDNMEKIDNILERYKKYQIDFIDADTETNIALIRENSEISKLVKKIKKQFVKEIEKLYPEEKNKENLIDIKYVDTEDLRKEIDEEIENRNTRIEVLNSDLADAKALIEIAETFEQKMEILKNYNIIDKEGRINIYE